MRMPVAIHFLILLILLAVPLRTGATEPAAPATVEDDTLRVEQAVHRAVPFLIRLQKADGGIYEQQYSTSMTALSVMALCAVGYLPSDPGPEGDALRKAIAFLLDEQRVDPTGYYGIKDGGRMYGHGIISLVLADLLGMGVNEEQDRLIRQRLDKAIQVILAAQERKQPGNPHYGGWRYTPDAADSDLSVTIWQLLALRAAKNAGVDVPKKAIDAAVGYLKRSYQSPRGGDGQPTNLKSACAYQPGGGPNFPMGSAGLLALQVCGEYDAPEVRGAADWLKEQKLTPSGGFFFYGTYYYAQGMHQRGGEYAETARRNVTAVLLREQQPDGGWVAATDQERAAGRIYATTMAVLSLSVQYHFLPIYQR